MYSVIVPYYNMGSHIHKTLHSLAEQTFKDFELIIVDDGSIIPFEEIVHGIELNYRIIRTPNQGVSVARNIGASLAEHEYLIFLDAGDSYDPHFLASLNAATTTHKHSLYATSFTLSKGKSHKPVDTGIESSNCIFTYNSYLEHICAGNYLFHICSIAINKKLFFLVGGFKPLATHGEDHEFILKCMKAEDSVYFINKGLFHYSLDDESSATRSRKLQPIYEHAYFLKEVSTSTLEEKYFAYIMLDFLIVNIKKGFISRPLIQFIKFLPVRSYRAIFSQAISRYFRHAKK